MHPLRKFWLIVLLMGAFICPARGQGSATVRPWWVVAEFGEGQLQLTSDQVSGKRHTTFALGFSGGHTLGDHARIGLEANGWLLQAFNLHDPTVGESVSNVAAVVDVFPIRSSPFFLRGGTGAAFYENRRPNASGGSGWCWSAGAGYEVRISKNFGLAPMAMYSSGRLGDVRNATTTETGRSYSVVEFKAAFIFHFGRPGGR